MIVSQERAFLNAQAQVHKLCEYVEHSADSGERIDRVERELFSQLLAIGLRLLRAFVAGQGNGDAGPSVEIDGATLRRLADQRDRRYLSVFGLVGDRPSHVRKAGGSEDRARPARCATGPA